MRGTAYILAGPYGVHCIHEIIFFLNQLVKLKEIHVYSGHRQVLDVHNRHPFFPLLPCNNLRCGVFLDIDPPVAPNSQCFFHFSPQVSLHFH